MNFIVSVDKNWAIGKNNDLLFHISADMKYFKETTWGKTVVMGDRTLLSLPGAKPLKGRENIVLTLDKDFSPEGVTVCHGTGELEKVLGEKVDTDDVFVIGGATIYRLLMPYCKKAYITKVSSTGDADVFIPDLDALGNWRIISESDVMSENGLEFRYLVYENNSVKPLG